MPQRCGRKDSPFGPLAVCVTVEFCSEILQDHIRFSPRAPWACCRRDRSSEGGITAAAPYQREGDPRVARLQKELACRDEVIVALQHVIRDLRHELENLTAEHRYAAFALEPLHSEDAA